MITPQPWLDWTFDFSLPVGRVPSVLERLRGTPARLEDRLRDVPFRVVGAHVDNTWSIQETVGHLVHTDALWMTRLDDFEAGTDVLEAANFDRSEVDDRGYDHIQLVNILAAFRAARMRLVARIESLDPALHERRALHPRLNQQIRIIDLMLFAADHDDHHLARITTLLSTVT
jgi:uncharacterized damage-inducible protein DinB